jgi:catechol 2,3-dioxygenase-like lactoylglutathione lyase family enzyme
MLGTVSEIVAPRGSPLSFAVVGCESLGRSLAFYRDVMGLDPSPPLPWEGSAFEALWAVVPGLRARASLLAAGGSSVGRILLVEFEAVGRVRGRVLREPNSRVIGLANLNFYVRDIDAAVARLGEAGCGAWTAPTRHDFAAAVGNPIEVLLDGPDGVPFNLVQLASADPATRVGQMRAYVEREGYTRTGFTPVVTSSHVCRSLARGRAFCERVLGMGALIDETLGSPRVNAFLRLPPDARTHVTFMQGGHMFGKVALGEPLNYLDACVDLRPRAAAPAIGLLAHAFEVADLSRAAAGCDALGVEWVMRLQRVELPGLGMRECLAVRNPGSGALQWVVGYSR